MVTGWDAPSHKRQQFATDAKLAFHVLIQTARKSSCASLPCREMKQPKQIMQRAPAACTMHLGLFDRSRQGHAPGLK